MRIAWITPCNNAYDNIIPYLEDADSLGWEVHIFHDGINNSSPKNKLCHLRIDHLHKLMGNYIILHYFLDDCDKCKDIKIKRIFGQRIFVSEGDSSEKFEEIIFKYYELI